LEFDSYSCYLGTMDLFILGFLYLSKLFPFQFIGYKIIIHLDKNICLGYFRNLSQEDSRKSYSNSYDHGLYSNRENSLFFAS